MPSSKESSQPILKSSDNNNATVIKKWLKRTVAIVGDSMISGINEDFV